MTTLKKAPWETSTALWKGGVVPELIPLLHVIGEFSTEVVPPKVCEPLLHFRLVRVIKAHTVSIAYHYAAVKSP
jgi:hypothetical protein